MSLLDHLLAFLLLVLIPARALWRSRTNRSNSESKAFRYLSTISIVSGLLLLLTVSWLAADRTAKALGLGVPATTPALVGLGFAAMLLIGLALTIRFKSASPTTDIQPVRDELLPETPREVWFFIVFSVAVGCGWEILYRGFLLPHLQAQVGLWHAIVVAAIAYGAAHGFKSPGQFAGSIAVAFVFTIGFAITWNLWWLMLLHTGLPLLSLSANAAMRSASPDG